MEPDEQDDPVQAALRKIRQAQGSGDPVADALAKIRARRVVPSATDVAAANAADAPPSPWQEAGKSVVGGIRTAIGSVPFGIGERALALGRRADAAMGWGVPQENMSYRDALDKQKAETENFSAENPRASLGLKMAANAPLFANLPATILGSTRVAGAVVGGGAAAANRIGATADESMGDRAKGTLQDAAIGAAYGMAAPWLLSNPVTRTAIGAGVGAYLAPEGHGIEGGVAGTALAMNPSGTARLASKMGGKVGDIFRNISEATGVRGAVNREMAGQQELSGPFGLNVGATGPAAGVKIATAVKFDADAKKLWDQVSQDKRVLDDPRVVQLLKDPDMARAFGSTERIRAEAGNPLPQAVTGSRQVPSPLLQANGQPFQTTVPITEPVPDPSGLHLTKRIIQDVVDRGFNTGSTIPIEDALRVQPKVDQLRALLHELSPTARAADRFTQLGKTAQEGFDRAFGSVKGGMQNPTAANLGENDPAGLLKWIAEQSHANPTHAAALRSAAEEGVRTGAKAQVAQQIAKAGPDAGRAGILDLPIMKNSGVAVEQRALALGANADKYNATLGRIDRETAADVPNHIWAPWKERAAIDMMGIGNNPLEKPAARALLRKISPNPIAYQNVLKQYLAGQKVIGLLGNQVRGQVGGMVGR